MKKYQGFTLVELAVVITIIGLLIGGVMQTQKMIDAARDTSTLSQVEAYRAAVSTFRQVYTDLPGDMDGEERLSGCNDVCKPLNDNAIGDGYVGNNWGTYLWQFRQPGLGGSSAADSENTIFWLHLYRTNLITDVTDALQQNPNIPFRFGVTHPAAAVGGGFIVKHPRSRERTAGMPVGARGIQGLVFGLAKYPYYETGTTGGLDQTSDGENVLTPGRAASIDRIADDGYPASGIVQAYGTASSCFIYDHRVPGDYKYSAETTGKDCGLIFKVFR